MRTESIPLGNLANAGDATKSALCGRFATASILVAGVGEFTVEVSAGGGTWVPAHQGVTAPTALEVKAYPAIRVVARNVTDELTIDVVGRW